MIVWDSNGLLEYHNFLLIMLEFST